MSDRSKFLPYGRQSVDEADIEAVVRVLRSDYLTTGPEVPRLESDLCAATGAGHVVACANGTAALHLANMALGFGPEDSVIVPSITFVATANAVSFTGAEIVFADVDPETGLITQEALADAAGRATRRPKAAYIVHLGGQQPDMEALFQTATDLGIFLVEDASHAIGSRALTNAGVTWCVGETRYSKLATFSFHPVKTIAAGEGGAICTDDADLVEKMSNLRSHGLVRAPERMTESHSFDDQKNALPWAYEMPQPGLNYRMSDIHAALLRSQLGKLDGFVARRSELIGKYDQAINASNHPIKCVRRMQNQSPAWHLAQILIDFSALSTTRLELSKVLKTRGIGTQVHYIPVHKQPYYRAQNPSLELPGVEQFARQTLSLPLFPAMSDVDLDRVISSLNSAFEELS